MLQGSRSYPLVRRATVEEYGTKRTGSVLPATPKLEPTKKGKDGGFLNRPTSMSPPSFVATSGTDSTETTAATSEGTTVAATAENEPTTEETLVSNEPPETTHATPDTTIANPSFEPPPSNEPQTVNWKLRSFDVTVQLQRDDTVESFTKTVRLSMTTFLGQRYLTMDSLDLQVQEEDVSGDEKTLHYSGSTVFASRSNEVVHDVQIWQAQQEFLEDFLVETKPRGVLSIRLENGLVIGQGQQQTDGEVPLVTEETSSAQLDRGLPTSSVLSRWNGAALVATLLGFGILGI